MIQSFSAKAINSADTLHNNVAITHERIAYNKVDQPAIDTSVSVQVRGNTLAVKTTPNGILLNWMVEETANLQYFLIEHSTDGQNFLPLYEVPVQLHQQIYSYVDGGNKTSDKKIYYRVKAIYPTVVIESPIRNV